MTTAHGHVAGMPVVVEAYFDGEEWQCPGCMRRFTSETAMIAHAMDSHRYLVKGGNK